MKYRKLAIVLIVLVIVGGIIGFVRGVNAELRQMKICLHFYKWLLW